MLVPLSDVHGIKFWIMVSVMGFLLATVVLLWKFPLTIARKISPSSQNSDPISWNSETLIAVGASLLGMYFLYYAITDLVYWLFIWLYSQNVGGHVVELNTEQKVGIIVTCFEVAISMFLIGGAGVISQGIHLLRYGSVKSSNKQIHPTPKSGAAD